mgnify:CR=1 FL=1
MERETRTLTTPAAKQLVLKTYLTARERRTIRQVYLNKSRTTITPEGEPKTEVTDSSVLDDYENAQIVQSVVSYDGTSENLLDRLLDAHPDEMIFVLKEISPLTENPKPAK